MLTKPNEDRGMIRKDFTLEIRSIDETKGEFLGVASVYGVEDLGGDIIESGAFKKTIAERPQVPILWQHKSGEVIGMGTVTEKGNEVLIHGQLDMEDPTAANAHRKMKKGLISGLSIGFQAVKTNWEEVKDRYIRHITELKLWEVSVVTFPMLPEAQVTSVKQDSSLTPEPPSTPAVEPPAAVVPADKKGSEPEVIHSLLSSILQKAKEY